MEAVRLYWSTLLPDRSHYNQTLAPSCSHRRWRGLGGHRHFHLCYRTSSADKEVLKPLDSGSTKGLTAGGPKFGDLYTTFRQRFAALQVPQGFLPYVTVPSHSPHAVFI